jgi:hypothetical protein
MTKWPVRDGSPFDDGGEAFQKACVEELMSESRELCNEYDVTRAYECVCGTPVTPSACESHAAECDKLADFVRASE